MNLLGYFSPLRDDSELYDLLRQSGLKNIREISRCQDFAEYEKMSNEQLLALVQKELYVDESKNTDVFKGKDLAQYLERAMYVCPDCGLTVFQSTGDTIACTKCKKTAKYLPNGRLDGFAFESVATWYRYQCEFINGLDLETLGGAPVYEDNGLRISKVQPYKRKTHLDKDGGAKLYKDRISLTIVGEEKTLTFEDIDVATVLGRNKLNLYHGGNVYQIKGDARFNALKYVNFCYRYKNKDKEGDDGKFLGL